MLMQPPAVLVITIRRPGPSLVKLSSSFPCHQWAAAGLMDTEDLIFPLIGEANAVPCPASGPMRRAGMVEEGRISGSS